MPALDNNASAERMAAAFSAMICCSCLYRPECGHEQKRNHSGRCCCWNSIVFVTRLKVLMPRGLHAYDGHHRDPDLARSTIDCDKDFEPVLVQTNSRIGLDDPEIIAADHPTFPIHARRPVVECSPGTCVFWDKGYSDLCPEQPFEPAVVIVTRVISLPLQRDLSRPWTQIRCCRK